MNEDEVLTKENLKPLIEQFVKNGLAGSDEFIDKLKKQLKDIPAGSIVIFATAVWLWRLPPINTLPQSRKDGVQEILKLSKSDDEIIIDEKSDFFSSDIRGFAAPGTYYNTNKPFELAYIITFFNEWLEKSEGTSAVEILKDMGAKSSIKEKGQQIKEVTKTASMYNALLHLFEPGYYEPILSNKHKEQIVEKLGKELCLEISNKNNDDVIADIRKLLKLGINQFYDTAIRELWEPALLAKNVIYHGAPGTGKTYLAEKRVKSRVEAELKKINKEKRSSNYFYEVVQFHPSFGYEEFIDGIKPDGVNDAGNVELKLVNGVFKQMCQRAVKELKENPDSPKKFYFIADEINRAELSRVFGEVLLCLEEDKRLRLNKEGEWEGTRVKTLNSNLWDISEDAVITVNGEGYFGIPENLYFIGTMNDVDRSVDSFDMALRRRFYWQYFECKDDVITERYFGDKNASSYIESCENLNKLITQPDNNGWGLGTDYQLGHAYFMKPDKLTKIAIEETWEKHLEPLLREYLRSVFSLSEIDAKLKEAKAIYQI